MLIDFHIRLLIKLISNIASSYTQYLDVVPQLTNSTMIKCGFDGLTNKDWGYVEIYYNKLKTSSISIPIISESNKEDNYKETTAIQMSGMFDNWY